MPDKRALKILFDTYWSSTGWRSAGKPDWQPQTPADDFAYAVKAGVMFEPKPCSHDEAVSRIQRLRSEITPSAVGNAFVASLAVNQPGLRSALGTYAVALHLPIHRYSPRRNGVSCAVCGGYDSRAEQDFNVLNFERHKWGGVRHEDPNYIAFDLERFRCEPIPEPAVADQALLAQILSVAGNMPQGAKLGDLVRAITPIVPGNKDQRRCLIGILGFAGVLPTPDHPGFFRSFTRADDRKETPWSKDDWPYPVRWWRGGLALDTDAVSFWFGRCNSGALDVSS